MKIMNFFSLFLLFAAPKLALAAEALPQEFNAGLELEVPLIRRPIESYAQRHGRRRLLLGEGHIYDPSKLPPEFQEGGDQSLTTSCLDDKLDFHENEGFYTASAETNGAFNSDWVGDLTNEKHHASLFIENTFDVIFEATYCPSAITKELFSAIAKSLRPGGVFIMPLGIEKVDDKYGSVYKTSVTPMDWFNRGLKFTTMQKAYRYWKVLLSSSGFSKIDFYESSVTKIMQNEYGDSFVESADLEGNQGEISLKAFKAKLPKLSKSTEVAALDPHLAHYVLSTHYFIARK